MKMKPPANSSNPTRRKKPRIMRHPLSLGVSRCPAPSAISGAAQEIQPHQQLIRPWQQSPAPALAPAKALTLHLAASISRPNWRRAQSRRRCSFERGRRRFTSFRCRILDRAPETISVDQANRGQSSRPPAIGHCRRTFENMANTTSAKKATRKIARRTVINKSRRTEMRTSVRTVEEAIKRGDRAAALKAMATAEPELMRAAQRNIVHKNAASRKVSRLAHQIAKLAK